MAFCAGLLLTGSVSLAANDGAGEQRDAAAVPSVEHIDVLLTKVELQVSTGHAMSPPEDSAMDTWQRVLQLQKASPDSPAILAALADFVARMRTRAADEKTAGRLVVSSDLTVFADQATRLLGHSGNAPASPGDNTRMAASRSGPDSQPSTGQRAPGTGAAMRDAPPFDALASPLRAPPKGSVPAAQRGAGIATGRTKAPTGDQTNREASPPTGSTDAGTARSTTASVNPEVAVPPAQDQSGADFYARRGDEMMAIKDVTAARKFYEYAANAGSARAATALARTLDSDFAAKLGLIGLKPDPVLAATWYRKAAELGDPDAEARLRTLLSNEAAVK